MRGVPASDRRRQPEHGSSLDSRVVEYIGPSEDSHLFIETAREEGLDVTYSPLMSARRGEEIFEVGEVTVTGRELRTRTARAMNRVLNGFPWGTSALRPTIPAPHRQVRASASRTCTGS